MSNSGKLTRAGLQRILSAAHQLLVADKCEEQDFREVALHLSRLLTSHERPVSGSKIRVMWSVAALTLVNQNGGSLKGTEVDHAVPVLEAVKWMEKDDASEIIHLNLESCFWLVRLTEEEHVRVNKKYQKTMPVGWSPNSDNAWKARYEAVEPKIDILDWVSEELEPPSVV